MTRNRGLWQGNISKIHVVSVLFSRFTSLHISYAGSSLTGVKTSWFKNSGRKSIPQLLLVLATTTSIDDIISPSRVMRDRGVRIESVGIGPEFDGAQLKEIATHPARDHVMAISKFDLLHMIRPLLTFRMCRGNINIFEVVTITS